LRDDVLERFFFPLPPMCLSLSQETREAVVWGIDRCVELGMAFVCRNQHQNKSIYQSFAGTRLTRKFKTSSICAMACWRN
jgi:hypothetical protein